MHSWGDKDSQGRDICSRVDDAAEYIGEWLRKFARINVMQYKEKFGTVRVYCSFGWENLGSITHPGYYFIPNSVYIFNWIRYFNFITILIQKSLYRYRYKKAVKKWPDLKEEILCSSDFPELLGDLWDPLASWDWPYLRTNFNGAKEYMCPHGTGHGGIHGYDGCCSHKSYERKLKKEKRNAKKRPS